MVWCNGFSNGLLCISGKCSGMESGDGPRESLWEPLTGVEQSLRTSTGDVCLLEWFGTDNMFVPWDYIAQQLESPITSSSALAPPSGMNHVAGDILNRVVSARESLSCIQSAVSENRTEHSAISKHNLWLQDAARDWICASVPALVMSHTESHSYEQIQRVEFQARCKENKCLPAVQERIPIRNSSCKNIPCQYRSSLHISCDHGLSARQLAENLESQDGRQYPGSHLVVEGTQNTGEDDVWECAIDQLEEHEEVNSSSERFSAGNFKSKNLLSEHNWRKKLNESLYCLQSVVPNISKVRYEFQLQTVHYDIVVAMPQIWAWLFRSTMNRHGMRGNWLHLPSSHFLVSEEIRKCDKTRIG